MGSICKSQELLLAVKVKVPLLYLASLPVQEGPGIKGKLAAFIPGSLELVQMSATTQYTDLQHLPLLSTITNDLL